MYHCVWEPINGCINLDVPRSDEELSDNEEQEEVAMATVTTGRERRRTRRTKSRNGMTATDMTPPDKLLRKAEKKAKKYILKKKVRSV